jgi:hypothetical protein
MSLSTTTVGSLHAVNDSDGILVLLKIDHASFTSGVRLVSDTKNIATLGDTYIGIPFAWTFPDDKSGQVPRARLQMDNTGRELTAELERLPPGAALQATVTVVNRATPGVIEWQFVSPLTGISMDVSTISANMGPDAMLRKPAVLVRFDMVNAPGVFAE